MEDTMPIGATKDDIHTMNIAIQNTLMFLDSYSPDDINIDNIEAILQRARLANIPSQYLGEIC